MSEDLCTCNRKHNIKNSNKAQFLSWQKTQ